MVSRRGSLRWSGEIAHARAEVNKNAGLIADHPGVMSILEDHQHGQGVGEPTILQFRRIGLVLGYASEPARSLKRVADPAGFAAALANRGQMAKLRRRGWPSTLTPDNNCRRA